MSVLDRERYARDRERIRARQALYRAANGEKWQASRSEKYKSDPLLQTRTIWMTMIRRCHDPRSDNFTYYGARGILVCQRWRESFGAFLSDVGQRPPGLSIDRIDNNGNYEPGNVRWATRSEQMRNRRPMPISCECGACSTCKNREYYRKYRAKGLVA